MYIPNLEIAYPALYKSKLTLFTSMLFITSCFTTFIYSLSFCLFNVMTFSFFNYRVKHRLSFLSRCNLCVLSTSCNHTRAEFSSASLQKHSFWMMLNLNLLCGSCCPSSRYSIIYLPFLIVISAAWSTTGCHF